MIMKKKHVLWAIIAFLLLFLCFRNISCSSKGDSSQDVEIQDKAVKVKPYETKVKGYLSDVLEIVDGEYTFNQKASYPSKTTIQVKIKSIAKGNANDYGFQDGNYGPLYLTICGSNGEPFASFSNINSSFESDGLLKDMMVKKSENWILFESIMYRDTLPDGVATFIITSKEIKDDTTETNHEDKDDDSYSKIGDKKWDKVLDEYEKYVDKYLEMIEDMNDEDNLKAILNYPSFILQTKKFTETLDEANNSKSLSVDQIKRMMDIQLEIVEAVSEIEDDIKTHN
jgi:hypothetical protein